MAVQWKLTQHYKSTILKLKKGLRHQEEILICSVWSRASVYFIKACSWIENCRISSEYIIITWGTSQKKVPVFRSQAQSSWCDGSSIFVLSISGESIVRSRLWPQSLQGPFQVSDLTLPKLWSADSSMKNVILYHTNFPWKKVAYLYGETFGWEKQLNDSTNVYRTE